MKILHSLGTYRIPTVPTVVAVRIGIDTRASAERFVRIGTCTIAIGVPGLYEGPSGGH
jgi:hypothetical protein